jgi:conjugative transfer signal peptidase TraF
MHRLVSAAAVVASAMALVGTAIVPSVPLLVWNVTASAPLGLYLRSTAPIHRRDWALVRAPDAARDLAAARHYLPLNVPMVKNIAALDGDLVCRQGAAVRINGTLRAIAQVRDSQSRLLPVWQGCVQLSAGQLFLLNAPRASFDSRYFGALPHSDLIERIVPLWTF